MVDSKGKNPLDTTIVEMLPCIQAHHRKGLLVTFHYLGSTFSKEKTKGSVFKSPKMQLAFLLAQIATEMNFGNYLTIANFIAILAIVFASGRLAEKVTNMENKVKECEENKIDTAVSMAKLEGFKVALDNSNRLLERVLYDKH